MWTQTSHTHRHAEKILQGKQRPDLIGFISYMKMSKAKLFLFYLRLLSTYYSDSFRHKAYLLHLTEGFVVWWLQMIDWVLRHRGIYPVDAQWSVKQQGWSLRKENETMYSSVWPCSSTNTHTLKHLWSRLVWAFCPISSVGNEPKRILRVVCFYRFVCVCG